MQTIDFFHTYARMHARTYARTHARTHPHPHPHPPTHPHTHTPTHPHTHTPSPPPPWAYMLDFRSFGPRLSFILTTSVYARLSRL